ncbi:unnamed protein product [Rangifer tarandus platyrhynchus]|uniref:Uncharacterized protein n=1 Tax=Rangifer tarandus platyrhynchus TaxID=3082113 RepID=A0AC59Z0Z8_RANTA
MQGRGRSQWGDESPPGLAGQPLIVYVKPGSWEDPPPHPSCACYLCPTAALGQRQWPRGSSGARTDFPAYARPGVPSPEGKSAFPALRQLSPCQRKGRASEKEAGL